MKSQIIFEKLRGGFYTPKPIADFLASWAIKSAKSKILEPSCGDGIFIESSIERLLKHGVKKEAIGNSIYGIEYDKIEAQKARKRIRNKGVKASSNHIYATDFFHYSNNCLIDKVFFDAIVGNPPFIRYQNFPEEQRVKAFALMKKAGLHPNRLTNIWIPFLIASTLLLKPNGRLAMVIPAELFQVNYASETRLFLTEKYSRVTIITFKKLVFKEVQQEVVLLLGERNGNEKHGIKVVEMNDISDLKKYKHNKLSDVELKLLDHSKEKWTQYFLENKEIGLLRSISSNPMLPVSGDIIDVDVGVVTGENKYFVLPEYQVKKNRLGRYVDRVVARSSYLKGAVISEADWNEMVENQNPTFLFKVPDKPFEKLPNSVRNYIIHGEQLKHNNGYKCRIRKHWYVVPSVWIPDAFMLRQVHGYPKLILNKSNATSTDTVHRIKFINGFVWKSIVASFLNSVTFAFSEVTGRSYGGGVLTFEPSEAENLPLPLKCADELDFNEIDRLLRKNKIETILDITDEILLKKGLNLINREIKMFRKIWHKLRDRRINRKS